MRQLNKGLEMTAHKHAEMIKAKADNMELVVFVKNSNTGEWWEVFGDLPFNQQQDFFLCLPQHKEACLHWLNGGDIQFRPFSSNFEWKNLGKSSGWSWNKLNNTMDASLEFRIKPRKEKRSIGVNVKTGQTTSAYAIDEEGNYAVDEVRLNYGISDNWKFIEIEVEI